MLVTLGWLIALGSVHPATQIPVEVQPHEAVRRQRTAGRISIWADREQPYQRGDGARVYVRTEEPGYVTIFRVDTDGRIRTLFPREPWRETFVQKARTLEVADSRQRPSFTVDDGPGIGYLLAIISPHPFEYDDITRGDYWNFRLVEDGRIRGDPYVALTALAWRIAPRGNYRYDIAPYYVERRYEYPRFVCYDCHSYASYDEWDPYATSCARYRLLIYDDPAYYPYRYNQGRAVVGGRPLRPAPRFVFKDVKPGAEYVTRLRQRESHEARRSRMDRGRTSADVGGPGVIPAPGAAAGSPLAPRGRAERGPVLRRDIPDPAAKARLGGDRKGERAGAGGGDAAPPEGLRPAEGEPRKVPPVQRGARNPQSTGEPELRRRKP